MHKKSPPKADTMVLPSRKTIIAQNPADHIMFFYGPPGVGKTWFVNSLGQNVLFLSTDRGTRSQMAMREETMSIAKLDRVLRALEKTPSNKLIYDIVCIDHVDDICRMLEDQVCARLGIESLSDAGYGKGWKMYSAAIHRIVARLKNLNLGVVFIAHESIKTVRARGIEVERTMPELGKPAWKALIPLADIVGYCTFKRVRGEDKKSKEIRVLETQPREDLYAKDRTRRTKPANGWEPLDGKRFIQSFSQSSTQK